MRFLVKHLWNLPAIPWLPFLRYGLPSTACPASRYAARHTTLQCPSDIHPRDTTQCGLNISSCFLNLPVIGESINSAMKQLFRILHIKNCGELSTSRVLLLNVGSCNACYCIDLLLIPKDIIRMNCAVSYIYCLAVKHSE